MVKISGSFQTEMEKERKKVQTEFNLWWFPSYVGTFVKIGLKQAYCALKTFPENAFGGPQEVGAAYKTVHTPTFWGSPECNILGERVSLWPSKHFALEGGTGPSVNEWYGREIPAYEGDLRMFQTKLLIQRQGEQNRPDS